MKFISYEDAMEYVMFSPPQIEMNRGDYMFRGFVMISSVAAVWMWLPYGVLPVILSGIVSLAMLLFSIKTIAIRLLQGPYTLFSDSLAFLTLSINLTLIATYIVHKACDNLGIGLIIPGLVNLLSVFMIAFYALIMIRKRLYKPQRTASKSLLAACIAAASSGWIFAYNVFQNQTNEQELLILTAIVMMLVFLINFGMIGFIKYVCFVIVDKVKREPTK